MHRACLPQSPDHARAHDVSPGGGGGLREAAARQAARAAHAPCRSQTGAPTCRAAARTLTPCAPPGPRRSTTLRQARACSPSCLRRVCHRPAPARQRATRRQRRELLPGPPERRCLASLRLIARASRRQGHHLARRGCADRAAARRADWPGRKQSAAALAAHRSAPWGRMGEARRSDRWSALPSPRGASTWRRPQPVEADAGGCNARTARPVYRCIGVEPQGAPLAGARPGGMRSTRSLQRHGGPSRSPSLGLLAGLLGFVLPPFGGSPDRRGILLGGG